MASETKIGELLDRVKAATGPDRKLDQAIFAWEYGWSLPLIGAALEQFRHAEQRFDVTLSIDAALALAERVLPGVFWRIERTLPSHWHTASFWATCGRRGEQEEGHGATPALAILAALLTALSAPEKAGEEVDHG